MFLGTPKNWWIGMAIVFVVGLYLIVAGTGGMWGNVVGVLMVFAAILLFAAAPMRYGRDKRPKEAPTSPAAAAVIPPRSPQPRAAIEARDADEV